MASVGFSFPMDKVVAKARTAMPRRYCESVRVCARTGWEMRCGAPLFRPDTDSFFDEVTCRICGLRSDAFTPDATRDAARTKLRVEYEQRRAEANAYSDSRSGYPMTHHNGATCSDTYMASVEKQLRPRAVIEDVEPHWKCSVREVLDEMGITAEVMSMAEAIAVHSYEQLDPEMQRFLDDPGRSDVLIEHSPSNPALPPGVGHTSAEWRRAIARLHQHDSTWMSPMNAIMAWRTKEQYGVAHLHERAWGAVPYAQIRSSATMSFVYNLTSDSHWYGAINACPNNAHIGPALNSVTGLSLVVAATQHTDLDDDG